MTDEQKEKFRKRIDKTATCWLWKGSIDSKGYGSFLSSSAHRFSWVLANGRQIPNGLEIDHVCRVRNCVNPDHLEAVTHAENVRRGISPSAIAARKKFCKYGHPLSGDNLYYLKTKTTWRICKTCAKNNQWGLSTELSRIFRKKNPEYHRDYMRRRRAANKLI